MQLNGGMEKTKRLASSMQMFIIQILFNTSFCRSDFLFALNRSLWQIKISIVQNCNNRYSLADNYNFLWENIVMGLSAWNQCGGVELSRRGPWWKGRRQQQSPCRSPTRRCPEQPGCWPVNKIQLKFYQNFLMKYWHFCSFLTCTFTFSAKFGQPMFKVY